MRDKTHPMLVIKSVKFKTKQIDIHAFHFPRINLEAWMTAKRRFTIHRIGNGRIHFDSKPLHACEDCKAVGSICVELYPPVSQPNATQSLRMCDEEDVPTISIPVDTMHRFKDVVKEKLDWERMLNIITAMYRHFPMGLSLTINNSLPDAYRVCLSLSTIDSFYLRSVENIYQGYPGFLRQHRIWIDVERRTLDIDVLKHNAPQGSFVITRPTIEETKQRWNLPVLGKRPLEIPTPVQQSEDLRDIESEVFQRHTKQPRLLVAPQQMVTYVASGDGEDVVDVASSG